MVADVTPAKVGVPLVVGLGDPVMDILASVSVDWLQTVTAEPGGCLPVPPEEMERLLANAGTQSELVRIPGGSAANVVKGVANINAEAGLEPGASPHPSPPSPMIQCRFIGVIGRDATGAEYRRKLAAQGVAPLLLESSSGAPSASAVCLVTPDGQRTMRTCLGASLELKTAAQLPPGWAAGCRLLHAEGYCLYRPQHAQLAREMMLAARAAGALVSIDLASFELVRNCKEALLGLLKDGLVDLVFANEEEAVTLCKELHLLDTHHHQPPAAAAAAGIPEAAAPNGAASEPTPSPYSDTEACVAAAQRFLLSPQGGRVKVAVTSLGARGCVARGADGEEGAAPACRVTVVDTIGAGDFFTAGFLSAHLRGGSLQQCCAAGCAAGCEAVQATGAELPPTAFARLRAALASILGTQPASVQGGEAAAAVVAAANAVAAALSGIAGSKGAAAAGGGGKGAVLEVTAAAAPALAAV